MHGNSTVLHGYNTVEWAERVLMGPELVACSDDARGMQMNAVVFVCLRTRMSIYGKVT
jgi:hypothetical protein